MFTRNSFLLTISSVTTIATSSIKNNSVYSKIHSLAFNLVPGHGIVVWGQTFTPTVLLLSPRSATATKSERNAEGSGEWPAMDRQPT